MKEYLICDWLTYSHFSNLYILALIIFLNFNIRIFYFDS